MDRLRCWVERVFEIVCECEVVGVNGYGVRSRNGVRVCLLVIGRLQLQLVAVQV